MRLAGLLLFLAAAARGKVYWASGGELMRSHYDGSDEEVLLTGLGEVDGLDVHARLGLVFWADFETSSVQRCALDGSDAQDVVTGLSVPFGVAVDEAADKVYWTEAGSPQRVRRANLDGSDVEDMTSDDLYWPTHVRVMGDWVYYSDAGREWNGGSETSIRRVSTNATLARASGPEMVLQRSDFSSNSLNQIYGFDVQDEWLYYSATKPVTSGGYAGIVQRARIADLVNASVDAELDGIYAGLDAIYGLAVDADAGDVWWTSFEDDSVWKGDLAGSDAAVMYADGQTPWGVVAHRREDRCGGVFCVATPIG